MADYGAPISLSQARDMSQTSDDEDDDHSPRSAAPLSACAIGSGPTRLKITNAGYKGSSSGGGGGGGNGGGGSGEMGSAMAMEISGRKPRGRPPGSKNKPKPPIVITRDSESAMRPTVLEISAGSDVFEMVVQYARRRHVGLTMISGSGSVSNVTLRHPGSHAPSITLRGPLNILSLSGTFFGPSTPPSSSSSSKPPFSFGITLAGTQGQVFGGIVSGKVMAVSVVVVVAATFQNPTLHRLPTEIEEGEEIGGGGGGETCSTTSAMSMYNVGGGQPANPTPLNCQISPDVLSWGPTSRPPY
ncbi:hypothetical protein L1049_019031 [Liquidambar formosana]|uniref:PPC domain-containing protein n=1 Tax=Liquidambar formosana TaxID=63359 RepID=A0AAP0RBV6_LIQFO